MGATPLTFQDMILTLEHYWAEKGCTVMQPYDSEVGAGTFHTATILRSLGPDAWRTCYPQPCRRPADRSEERRVGKEGRARWAPDH